jgi:hypothetical protein
MLITWVVPDAITAVEVEVVDVTCGRLAADSQQQQQQVRIVCKMCGSV